MLFLMTTARGCVWEMLGNDSLVITYCDDAGTTEQWNAYIRMMHGLNKRGARYLIYCAAVPARDVLSQLAIAARGQPWQVALVSPSTAVRFAASTFSLVVRSFRFFTPDSLREALQHLQCDEAEQDLVRRSLSRLRGVEISVPPK
jgi:hypothetical protein